MTITVATAGLPAGWQRTQMRRLASIPITNGVGEAAQDLDEGFVRYVRTTDIEDVFNLDEAKAAGLPPEIASAAMLAKGDLVMTAAGATIGKSHLFSLDQPACYAGFLVRFRADLTTVAPRFLAWWTQSSDYSDQIATGAVKSTIENFSASKYRAMLVPTPDLLTQRSIADFLDRETTQIDALVAAQRELVKLLEERRSSMIWRLVTKGVRETDMRDSGATWIGSVPSHWGVHRLKNSVASSRSGVWGDEPTGDGTDVRCVRVADFDRPRLRVHDLDITMRSVEPRDLRERGLRDGDLLLEKSGGTARNPVGFVVMYEGSGPAVCSNFVSRVRVKPGQVPRYWLYAHAASYTYRLTQRSVNQTTGIQNLDEGAYFNEPFPYPPRDEQVEIADHIASSTARMDTMIEAANESIALMLERRSALISAAVTGRIDPRTGKEIKEAS